jgi:hypothetical protein
MKVLPVFSLLLISLLLILQACSRNDDSIVPSVVEQGDYSITAPYDSIRTYPGGGGLFLVSLRPAPDYAGDTRLRIEAPPLLHATVRPSVLTATDTVAEILLRPEATLAIDRHAVTVIAEHAGSERRLHLSVIALVWSPPDSAAVLQRIEAFRAWCAARDPALAAAFAVPEFIYNTYPEILIVEHHTILAPAWEVRLCAHVMIPPWDWSKLRLRRRGSIEPLLAAQRESDGSIREIPVSEYPTLCGY